MILAFLLLFSYLLTSEIIFQIKYIHAKEMGYIVDDYVVDFGDSKHYTMIQTETDRLPKFLDNHMAERQLLFDYLDTIFYVSINTGFFPFATGKEGFMNLGWQLNIEKIEKESLRYKVSTVCDFYSISLKHIEAKKEDLNFL